MGLARRHVPEPPRRECICVTVLKIALTSLSTAIDGGRCTSDPAEPGPRSSSPSSSSQLPISVNDRRAGSGLDSGAVPSRPGTAAQLLARRNQGGFSMLARYWRARLLWLWADRHNELARTGASDRQAAVLLLGHMVLSQGLHLSDS